MGFVRRKHHEFNTKALAQANYFITTPRFIAWLTDPDSDILLADGHCKDQDVGRVSPMSILCAGLVEAFSGAYHDTPPPPFPFQPPVVLYFFAGLHTANEGGLLGPRGLIRSLIDQLLLHWPDQVVPDTRLIGRQLGASEVACNFDMPRLCYVFEQLLRQLGPNSPVYCILDGISHFETSIDGWLDDLREIVECFLSCLKTNQRNIGMAPIKFLLVSADKSTNIWNILPKDCHLDLRAGNLHSRPLSGNALMANIREVFRAV